MTDQENGPSIRLDHFLQICGVPTGGQAKQLIQSGMVLVNQEIETRRRKKLAAGDVVSIDGEEYDVGIEPPEDNEDPKDIEGREESEGPTT